MHPYRAPHPFSSCSITSHWVRGLNGEIKSIHGVVLMKPLAAPPHVQKEKRGGEDGLTWVSGLVTLKKRYEAKFESKPQ